MEKEQRKLTIRQRRKSREYLLRANDSTDTSDQEMANQAKVHRRRHRRNSKDNLLKSKEKAYSASDDLLSDKEDTFRVPSPNTVLKSLETNKDENLPMSDPNSYMLRSNHYREELDFTSNRKRSESDKKKMLLEEMKRQDRLLSELNKTLSKSHEDLDEQHKGRRVRRRGRQQEHLEQHAKHAKHAKAKEQEEENIYDEISTSHSLVEKGEQIVMIDPPELFNTNKGNNR